jgi:serine/threonine-protein kinase
MTATLDRLTAALADRYRLERELGQGGMATVYLAHDLKHDRNVAVKVLRPELAAVIGAERFLSEIKTTANLQHPHILPLHDSGSADGFLFYVMPYVEGVSLRERITREHQLPVDDAVRIAREVAGALDYAHRHGVIHRDIKPENILLHDGSALVADFGIALAVSTAGTRMTETGMSLGTPHYMSPEQAMGEREITARSDVYALGCVTYEMLVGEPPFTGPTAQAIIARVMTEEPRHLTLQRRSIPPQVESAVLHALEKLPADRFTTAAQFADALAGHGSAAAARTVALPAARRGTVGRDAERWRRWFLVACGATVVAAGIGGWAWVRARTAAERPIERHYLALGDSVRLASGPAAGLALSPDGSRLAFIADSLSRIWIKRRDQLDAVPLAGTEHALTPVFSPDGQWLAYLSNGQVRKVPVAGGASIAIADSASAIGGVAWLDDGTLVYSNASLLGLRRVSASGGPVTVVLPDSVFKGLGLLLPTALPHARGVIFQSCASGCVTMQLNVLDLRTGRTKLLFKDVAMGWYLPSGRLLYVRRDGVALVAPFDLKSLEVRGAGTAVLQGVAQNLANAQLAVSASGRLVYGLGGASNDVLTLERVDRDGTATSVDSTWHGTYNSLALSPDGTRMAVGVGTPGAGLDIWIKQLDHGPFTRLTFSGRDRRPTWSPDGREVAFIRDTANGGGDVYARAVNGSGGDRRLVHIDRRIQEVTWSRDGRWLIVRTETGSAGNGDILAVPAHGDSVPVRVATSPFAELEPTLSPDGRWVAYTSNEAGADEVYVRPFPNTDAGRWQVSNGGGTDPVWSPDGRQLYFIRGGSRLIAAQVAAGPTFSVPELRTLFDVSRFTWDGFHQLYDVTRDGRFMFLGPFGPTARGARLVEVENWFAELDAEAGR